MKYSFIVPIYNDGSLAEAFAKAYEAVFQAYLGVNDISSQVELIFVNDGSPNQSMDDLMEVSKLYSFVKVIELSRNFGQHIALTAGYHHAKGDYVGMLNVDMQEHPQEIPRLLEVFQSEQVDIVYGLRKKRKGPFMEKFSSIVFNVLLNKLTGSNTPLNVSTLRVMNRRFLDAYLQLQEKSRYLPGLENWLGFKQGFVEISHEPRSIGKSSYNLKKRLMMALESIISFSDLPLKIISIFGFIIAFTGFLLILLLIASKLLFLDFLRGYTSTVSIIVFLGGIQIMVTGFASLYIGRILTEVQNRPLFIIRQKINF